MYGFCKINRFQHTETGRATLSISLRVVAVTVNDNSPTLTAEPSPYRVRKIPNLTSQTHTPWVAQLDGILILSENSGTTTFTCSPKGRGFDYSRCRCLTITTLFYITCLNNSFSFLLNERLRLLQIDPKR